MPPWRSPPAAASMRPSPPTTCRGWWRRSSPALCGGGWRPWPESRPGHPGRGRGGAALRRAAGAVGAAGAGALLGRPVRACPLRLGPQARRLRGRRPDRAADPALPDLGQPRVLAVCRRPARPRRARRSSTRSSSARPGGRWRRRCRSRSSSSWPRPEVLEAFGPGYEVGATPLRIMLLGQTVNVATGGVAFVLVMAGFTGLDLADNLLAGGVLFALAIPLAAAVGPTGAAAASAAALAAVNMRAPDPGLPPGGRAAVRRRLRPPGRAGGGLRARGGGPRGPAPTSQPWWVVGGGDDARRRRPPTRCCCRPGCRPPSARPWPRSRAGSRTGRGDRARRPGRGRSSRSAGSATMRRTTSGGWSRRSSST